MSPSGSAETPSKFPNVACKHFGGEQRICWKTTGSVHIFCCCLYPICACGLKFAHSVLQTQPSDLCRDWFPTPTPTPNFKVVIQLCCLNFKSKHVLFFAAPTQIVSKLATRGEELEKNLWSDFCVGWLRFSRTRHFWSGMRKNHHNRRTSWNPVCGWGQIYKSFNKNQQSKGSPCVLSYLEQE